MECWCTDLQWFPFCVCLDAQVQRDESIQWLLPSRHQCELQFGTSNRYQEERMKHPTQKVLFVLSPVSGDQVRGGWNTYTRF